MDRYIILYTGYHRELGKHAAGDIVTLADDVACRYLKCKELPNGIIKKDGSDPVKKAPPNKSNSGTIDISDGVSDKEAALAGRALSARKHK